MNTKSEQSDMLSRVSMQTTNIVVCMQLVSLCCHCGSPHLPQHAFTACLDIEALKGHVYFLEKPCGNNASAVETS